MVLSLDLCLLWKITYDPQNFEKHVCWSIVNLYLVINKICAEINVKFNHSKVMNITQDIYWIFRLLTVTVKLSDRSYHQIFPIS